MAARSRYDQIGSLLVRDLRDHMCRASGHHVRQLERRVESFPLQVLDLLPDRGLDLVLIQIDRTGGPACRELVYVVTTLIEPVQKAYEAGMTEPTEINPAVLADSVLALLIRSGRPRADGVGRTMEIEQESGEVMTVTMLASNPPEASCC